MSKSLMSKLLKSVGKGSRATVLSQSNFFEKDTIFRSRVPIINLMIAGAFDAGISPGIHQLVGDSRTFKTNFCLSLVADFLEQNPEGILIFVDSEFGASKYFDAFGIDKNRVIHIPVENLEEMKFQITQTLDSIEPGEKVMYFVDSISQIASKKEVENALNENAAADLTRAREMNSFFRIITPKLQIRKIPFFCINSYYDSIANQYAEPTLKGGKQTFLSSDVILFVTRSQVKEDGALSGWSFNYSTMKSRYVQEKSKFSVVVKYDGGIEQFSGIFDLALESGFLTSPTQGFYSINLPGYDAERKHRRKALEEDVSLMNDLLKNNSFKEYCRQKYALEAGAMFTEESLEMIDEETGEVITQ